MTGWLSRVLATRICGVSCETGSYGLLKRQGRALFVIGDAKNGRYQLSVLARSKTSLSNDVRMLKNDDTIHSFKILIYALQTCSQVGFADLSIFSFRQRSDTLIDFRDNTAKIF